MNRPRTQDRVGYCGPFVNGPYSEGRTASHTAARGLHVLKTHASKLKTRAAGGVGPYEARRRDVEPPVQEKYNL